MLSHQPTIWLLPNAPRQACHRNREGSSVETGRSQSPVFAPRENAKTLIARPGALVGPLPQPYQLADLQWPLASHGPDGRREAGGFLPVFPVFPSSCVVPTKNLSTHLESGQEFPNLVDPLSPQSHSFLAFQSCSPAVLQSHHPSSEGSGLAACALSGFSTSPL